MRQQGLKEAGSDRIGACPQCGEIWIVGETGNGEARFYVEHEVIQELQSHNLVSVVRNGLLKGIEEGYALNSEGHELYKQYRDMPSDQGAGEFLRAVHELRRRRGHQ